MGESKKSIRQGIILIGVIFIGIVLYLISKKIFGYVYGGGTLLLILYLFLWNTKFKSFSKENKIYLTGALFVISIFFFCAIPGGTNSYKVSNQYSTNTTNPVEESSTSNKTTVDTPVQAATKPNADNSTSTNTTSEKKGNSSTDSSLKIENDPVKFKASCVKISYNDLARNPDKYLGKNIEITGKVLQVLGTNKYSDMLIDVDGNILYMACAFILNYKGENILKGDSVTFWGYGCTPATYKTVQGANNTVPAVAAYFIQINK